MTASHFIPQRMQLTIATPPDALAFCRDFNDYHLSNTMHCLDADKTTAGSFVMSQWDDLIFTNTRNIFGFEYDRAARHIAGDGADSVFFHFNMGATDMFAEQAGRDYWLRAGVGGMYVQNVPIRMQLGSGCDIMGLELPRALTQTWLATPEDLAIRSQDCTSPAFHMLRHYVQLMLDCTGMPADLAAAMKVHMAELAGFWLGGLKGKDWRDRHPQSRQAARVVAITDLLTRNFSDPMLSAATVGRALGLSERMVQHILTQEGTSFSRLLARIRCEKALAILQQPRNLKMSVLDIAFQCGFRDLSGFYREFRKHHEDAPGAFRPKDGIN